MFTVKTYSSYSTLYWTRAVNRKRMAMICFGYLFCCWGLLYGHTLHFLVWSSQRSFSTEESCISLSPPLPPSLTCSTSPLRPLSLFSPTIISIFLNQPPWTLFLLQINTLTWPPSWPSFAVSFTFSLPWFTGCRCDCVALCAWQSHMVSKF